MEHLLYKEEDQEKMEEMMISTSTQSPCNQSNPSSPPWKLYHNPFYSHEEHPTLIYNTSQNPNGHCTCTIEATMKAELDEVKAQVIELEAELEFERRLRKKMEILNKRISKELEEEKKAKEAAEQKCEELSKQVSSHETEMSRVKKEMEEERRMLRVAEVFREERVQMKLEDAKVFYEEKLLRLDKNDHQEKEEKVGFTRNEVVSVGSGGGGGFVSPISVQRRASPEPENPHIKRGIRGSVEFQRVVRAMCTNKSNRHHLGGNYKLECQKAQLKILLKQRSPIAPNSLIMS